MRQRKEINKQQLFKYHLLTTMRQQQMPHTEHNYLTFTISLNLYKTCDTGILLLLHDGKRMRLREFKKYAQNEQSCLDLNPDRAPQSAPSLAFHTQYQEVLTRIYILLYWSPSIKGSPCLQGGNLFYLLQAYGYQII